ncbi:hypothetical protein BSNT_09867 [Bacillus subtilis subsp. natto BEST195]|nr:hypothetical protein BSNT_09867 [Bacillus subtilis subsp. natto BEST195]
MMTMAASNTTTTTVRMTANFAEDCCFFFTPTPHRFKIKKEADRN